MKKSIFITIILFSLFCFKGQATCEWTGDGDGTSWGDAFNWLCGHVPTPDDEVIIGSGAMVELDEGVLIKALELDGGSLEGTDVLLSVADAILWKSGIIDIDIVLLSGTMSMPTIGAKTLTKTLLLKTGTTCTWDGGPFFIDAGGKLITEFSSSFGVAFDGTIGFTTGTPGKIINTGTFGKAGGPDTLYVDVDFENTLSGIVTVMSGTMKLLKGMADNKGVVAIDSAMMLQIYESSMHDGSTSLMGKGTLDLKGDGPHDFAISYMGEMSFTFDAEMVGIDGDFTSSGIVNIVSGVIGGAGSLTIDSLGDWSGGTVELPMSISSEAMMDLSGSDEKILTSTLTQSGPVTWKSGDLAIEDGGSWDNSDIFIASSSGDFTFTGIAGSFYK